MYEILFYQRNKEQGISFFIIKEMYQAKEKYRGVFEIQKSGDKTSSGEIGLDINLFDWYNLKQDLYDKNNIQII